MQNRNYWNEKIVDWEKSRYGSRWAFWPFFFGIRLRMAQSIEMVWELLTTHEDLRITDLGCGTGILAQEISQRMRPHAGAAGDGKIISYFGIDISEIAIAFARQRPLDSRFCFVQGNVDGCQIPASDLIIMLGLTDWLSEPKLRALLTRVECQHLLISFSEHGLSMPFLLYRIYRKLNDRKVRTRNYQKAEFLNLVRACGWALQKDLSTPLMKPGRLLWLMRSTLKK